MRSSRSRRAILLVVALLSMSMIPLGIGSVAAQSNETASSSGASETIAQVDPDLRVTNVSYDEDGSIMSIELANREGGGGSQITITEVVEPGSGSSSFGIEQLRIYDGETTTAQLQIQGSTPGAMITSQDSIEEGSGSYVEAQSGLGLFEGSDATWQLVRLGSIGSLIGVITLLGLIVWARIAEQNTTTEVRV